MKTRFALGSMVLAAAVLAGAWTADYTFKFTPKVGATTKYKMSGTFDFEGMEILFTANVSNKVTKVNPDGSYTLEEAQTDSKASVDGQEFDVESGVPNLTTFDANGHILEIKGDRIDASAYRTACVSNFYKPSKSVKIGDSWTVEIKGDEQLGIIESKAVYTVEAEEQIGQWNAVRITFAITELTGATPAGSSGKIWIDPSDGEMIKVEGMWKDVPVPNAPALVTGKITVVRQ